MDARATVIVVMMGVAGSGKTTVGRLLAERLGWDFVDADDWHPPESVRKMRSGVPLSEEDRGPWLQALRGELERRLEGGEPAVLACSALTREHRRRLAVDERVRLVHLEGPPELVRERLRRREGHYMPAELLESQLETLEPPASHEALTLGIDAEPADVADEIQRNLGLHGG